MMSMSVGFFKIDAGAKFVKRRPHSYLLLKRGASHGGFLRCNRALEIGSEAIYDARKFHRASILRSIIYIDASH